MPRIHRLALSVLLAISCAMSFAGVGLAQQAPGDWNGSFTIESLGRVRTLGIHIDKTGASFTGTIFSPDTTADPTAIADIAAANGVLSFKSPAANSSFEGRWDETKKAWIGDYTTPQGKFPLTLAAGKPPPIAPLPAVAGLDGRWEGKLQGVTPLVVRLKTDIDGTVAQFDRPSIGATGSPIRSFTRDGQKIKFAVPSVGIVYEGELSPAGESITGIFSAAGSALGRGCVKTTKQFMIPAIAREACDETVRRG